MRRRFPDQLVQCRELLLCDTEFHQGLVEQEEIPVQGRHWMVLGSGDQNLLQELDNTVAEDSRDTIRKFQSSARCSLGFFLKVRFNPGQYVRAGSFANVGSYCMNVSFEGFGPPEKVLALLQKMIQPEGSSSSRVFETVTGWAKLVHGADIVRRPLRSP